MVPLRRHAAKSEGQSESRRSMLGMLPIELERVLCFGPRKLTMVWGPKGVASTVLHAPRCGGKQISKHHASALKRIVRI